ncbi:hypothetical protein DUI87_19791 [Hirundo rustica rustica]|uniref:ribonuclease H n=1 Tax=Hirundo rustica rustica TaxID=333673 RepID=A0A3M0JRJ8_HIRRU|nr:hypothetical protein DUI87_19791 [Hirundo rustica rustica]
MSPEGRKGLASVIEPLLKENILEPCMSPHNTPILAIKKDEGKFRLVQDLREINKRTIARHPVVPNPYTLLSKIPREHTWFTVIDLKDAFWACPLAEECRDWFAFEWEHPDRGRKQRLRWTRLPQGYTESPNIFGQALETLLEQFSPKEGVPILQYVDDLLISGETEKEAKDIASEYANKKNTGILRMAQEWETLKSREPRWSPGLKSHFKLVQKALALPHKAWAESCPCPLTQAEMDTDGFCARLSQPSPAPSKLCQLP